MLSLNHWYGSVRLGLLTVYRHVESSYLRDGIGLHHAHEMRMHSHRAFCILQKGISPPCSPRSRSVGRRSAASTPDRKRQVRGPSMDTTRVIWACVQEAKTAEWLWSGTMVCRIPDESITCNSLPTKRKHADVYLSSPALSPGIRGRLFHNGANVPCCWPSNSQLASNGSNRL